MWRHDGRELFYVSDRYVISALASDGRWEDATITPLFQTSDTIRSCAVMPDGQSFLVADWKAGFADDFIHVVLGSP